MKKKIIIISITSLLITTILLTILLNILTIKLNGKDTIDIKLYEEYTEKNATACVQLLTKCIDVSKDIKIKNNIDINKPGSYEVTYKIKYGFLNKTIKRKVNVLDVTAPTIELIGKKEINMCPNNNYKEEGYNVKDDYDKEVEVKVTNEENKLIYTAIDSSGNTSQDYRIVTYNDNEKPKLTFNNSSYILIGENFNIKNVSATDNCDGNITNKVKIIGDVNIYNPGTYKITYEVTDSSNNTTSITRNVVVYNKNNTNQNYKVIYLTFDDGPGPYTGQLLDILKKYNVQATFFITAQYGYDAEIKRIYNEGHTLGAHSYTHNYNQIYKSVDNYFYDLDLINNKIFKYTGAYTSIIRFPGGSSNAVSRFNPGIMTTLTREVKNRGYKYFDWNIDSGDTSTSDSKRIASNVINNLKNDYSVVLQHDIKYASVIATEEIIQYGLANGYSFQALNVNSYGAHHNVYN